MAISEDCTCSDVKPLSNQFYQNLCHMGPLQAMCGGLKPNLSDAYVANTILSL